MTGGNPHLSCSCRTRRSRSVSACVCPSLPPGLGPSLCPAPALSLFHVLAPVLYPVSHASQSFPLLPQLRAKGIKHRQYIICRNKINDQIFLKTMINTSRFLCSLCHH